MKKVYLSIFAILLGTLVSFGQEVAAQQKMLVTKITATWCPNCGTSAWDVKKDLINNFDDQAIFLATHINSSSSLFSTTAKEYAENLPNVLGQPLFYVNRERFSTSSVTSAISDKTAQNQGQMPLANAGLQMQLDGQKISVKAKVKFFQPADGAFYLSLFVIEDNVIENQASRGSNVSHSRVFRGRVTPDTFGELITNGSVAADETFDFRIDRALNPEWDTDNLQIAAVIWQKVGDTYEFVNTEAVSSYSTFTAVNHLEQAGVQLQVQPTTLNNQSTVAISLPSTLKNASLELVNTNGQLLKQLYQGNLNTGDHQFSLSKTSDLANGIYLVRLVQNGQSLTQKIVVK